MRPNPGPTVQRSLAAAAFAAASVLAGCGSPPVQTGNDHVPDDNVALAAAKDGKFETLAWPMVDEVMVGWLDGPFAPGCAVGVAVEDEIVYLKGYGRARLGLSAEDWSVSTMGAVGSVSKTLTALAAMRQVEMSWIDIEERAGDRLPLSGDLAQARLFRLLSHTAGAGGDSNTKAFAPNWTAGSPIELCQDALTPDPADPECTEVHRAALDPVSLAVSYADGEADNVAALEGVNVDDDEFDDGWQAVYSNVGYTVAGGMVGAVAQAHGYTGYEHFVWDSVGQWGPSWLTPGQATSLALIHAHRASDIPHRAVGYYDANWGNGPKSWQEGDAWEVTPARASWIGPAGGWAMTIGDLSRILVAYRHHKIVTGSTRSLMEAPIGHFDLGPDPSALPPYGLGVLVDAGNESVYHGGDIGPYNAELDQQQSSHSAHWSWWPDALPGGVDVGVTMICNNGRGSGTLYSRSKGIVDALKDDPGSRPVSTQTHSTSPSRGAVDGRRYKIDASRAYLVAPAGLPILPAAANPMVVTADLAHGVVRFAQPAAGASGPGTVLGQATGAVLTASGRLAASSGTLQVGIGPATLSLRDVSLSLQVADDGSRLFDGGVKGTADARRLVSLQIAGTVREVCTAVGEAGGSCLPCPDGARACFVASIGGVRATRLP